MLLKSEFVKPFTNNIGPGLRADKNRRGFLFIEIEDQGAGAAGLVEGDVAVHLLGEVTDDGQAEPGAGQGFASVVIQVVGRWIVPAGDEGGARNANLH